MKNGLVKCRPQSRLPIDKQISLEGKEEKECPNKGSRFLFNCVSKIKGYCLRQLPLPEQWPRLEDLATKVVDQYHMI